VAEALEAIEAVPLPARYGFWAVPSGIAVEVVAQADVPSVRRRIEQSLIDWQVPVCELHVVTDPTRLSRPFPLRCDLREHSFRPPTQRADIITPAAMLGVAQEVT